MFVPQMYGGNGYPYDPQTGLMVDLQSCVPALVAAIPTPEDYTTFKQAYPKAEGYICWYTGCAGNNAFGSYTVVSGDSCYAIAQAKCGDGAAFATEICNAASLCSPGNLLVGATIKYDCSKTGAHC